MSESAPNQPSLANIVALLGQVAQEVIVDKPSPIPSNYSQEQLDELWFPQLTGAREQLIETRLGSINVIVGGKEDGPAFLLWPSLMMKATMWSGQYEHFRHRYRMVLIDSPGINKSEGLRKIIDLHDCKDIVVTILDTLGIQKCVFGGNSWGAMLAAVLPAWIPERVVGTIVSNGTASVPSMPETMSISILAEMLMMCERVPAWWVSVASRAFVSDKAKTENPDFAAYVGCVAREDPKSIAWALKGILLGRKDYHYLLRTITDVPVLVIAGGDDHQFELPVVQKLADATPTSKLVVVDGVGHLAARECPGLINAEIETWMRENGLGVV